MVTRAAKVLHRKELWKYGIHVNVMFAHICGFIAWPGECSDLPQVMQLKGFPGGSDGKKSACNAGDPCSIPGSGISPGEENGHPLHYTCLKNSMHRGARQATVHGVEKSLT